MSNLSPSLNSKTSYLKIRPKELVYHPPFIGVITNELKLHNSSEEHTIAFKVKTTAPIRYCVRPNTGIIPPGKSIDVQILLNCSKDSPSISMKTKDKFQILSIIVTDPNIDPKSIWTNSPSTLINKNKLKAVFSLPSNEQSSSSNNTTTTGSTSNSSINTSTDYKSNSTLFSEVNSINSHKEQTDQDHFNSNNGLDNGLSSTTASAATNNVPSKSLKPETIKRNINNNTSNNNNNTTSDNETEKLRNQVKHLNDELEKIKKNNNTNDDDIINKDSTKEVAKTKGPTQIQYLIVIFIIAILSFVIGKFI